MNELTGAWTLTSAKFSFDDGGAIDIYGADAQGRILFTADGWMAVVITGSGMPSPTGEAAAAPVTLAYSGRYRVEGKRFVTAVDVSSMAPWRGTDQPRDFDVAGDVLSVVLGMPMHPAHPGRTGRGKLVFKRG